MSQEAVLLEREVTNYWLAHFFQAEKSKMKDRSWEALLLMWMRTVSQCDSAVSAIMFRVTEKASLSLLTIITRAASYNQK